MGEDPTSTGPPSRLQVILAPSFPEVQPSLPRSRLIQIQPSDVLRPSERRQRLASSRLDIQNGSRPSASNKKAKATHRPSRPQASLITSTGASLPGLQVAATDNSVLRPSVVAACRGDEYFSVEEYMDGLDTPYPLSDPHLTQVADAAEEVHPYWIALRADPAARFRLDGTLFVIQGWDASECMLKVCSFARTGLVSRSDCLL